jgi:hypothetical protein
MPLGKFAVRAERHDGRRRGYSDIDIGKRRFY